MVGSDEYGCMYKWLVVMNIPLALAIFHESTSDAVDSYFPERK